MNCPLGKKDCWGCEYVKEGLCDYPYKAEMTLEQIKRVSVAFRLTKRAGIWGVWSF